MQNFPASEGGTSPSDTPCAPPNHFSTSKPDLCPCIQWDLLEQNEWALIIKYHAYINWFYSKTCLQNEEKIMRGEAFLGLKNPENPGASGGSAPWTPARGVAPGPHQGPLSGPLDPTPLRRSLRSTWTQTIFIQPPAVTNPAHAHDLGRNSNMFFYFVAIFSFHNCSESRKLKFLQFRYAAILTFCCKITSPPS